MTHRQTVQSNTPPTAQTQLINLDELRQRCDALDATWPEIAGQTQPRLNTDQVRALLDAVEAAQELLRVQNEALSVLAPPHVTRDYRPEDAAADQIRVASRRLVAALARFGVAAGTEERSDG